MIDKIFTITTIRSEILKPSRCVGFFFDLHEAKSIVLNNTCDIYEAGYYPYCVIESVRPGLYSIIRSEYWFKWNKEKDRYEELDEKPKKFRNLCCFGIG